MGVIWERVQMMMSRVTLKTGRRVKMVDGAAIAAAAAVVVVVRDCLTLN